MTHHETQDEHRVNNAALEALRAVLPVVEQWADTMMYGFFPGGDPRNFTPDGIESGTTEEELSRWKADCAAADAGVVEQDPAGRWLVRGDLPDEVKASLRRAAEQRGKTWNEQGEGMVHMLEAKYGLGAYRLIDPEMAALRDKVRAGIAELEMKREVSKCSVSPKKESK